MTAGVSNITALGRPDVILISLKSPFLQLLKVHAQYSHNVQYTSERDPRSYEVT